MPKKILLSIKPDFAEKIFSTEKKYEFRRVLFAQKNVTTVVVYASSPIQKVIGQFEIEEVLEKNIKQLWQETEHAAGIVKSYFDEYFMGKDVGYAIKIKFPKLYTKEKCLMKDYAIQYPPQSFVYI